MTRPLVRAVFAVMIAATLGAFVLAQQLKSDFPLVIRFATKPAHFSPNGDGYRDTTQIGFDLSEPASVSFMVVDSEGTEVRRHRERPPARGRREAPVDMGRALGRRRRGSGRDLPDARGPPRREPGDRLGQGDRAWTPCRRRRRSTSAKPSVIATDLPGETPSVTLSYRGPQNRAPGDPRVPDRRRQAAHREALPRPARPHRHLGRPRERGRRAHRAGARGRLRVHRGRARQGRQHHRGAAAHAYRERRRGPARA